jgi:hypothetical protein
MNMIYDLVGRQQRLTQAQNFISTLTSTLAWNGERSNFRCPSIYVVPDEDIKENPERYSVGALYNFIILSGDFSRIVETSYRKQMAILIAEEMSRELGTDSRIAYVSRLIGSISRDLSTFRVEYTPCVYHRPTTLAVLCSGDCLTEVPPQARHYD